MLLFLEISNLATFTTASAEFVNGLNILSGMSGAGKSVFLKALNLALGGRFSQKLLRNGTEEAEVAALFRLPPALVEKWKESLRLVGDEVLIRRRFKKDGRSITQINDKLTSLELLAELGADVGLVVGQDDSMELKDPAIQLSMLDGYAEILPQLEDYRQSYQKYLEVLESLHELKEELQNESEKRRFWEFQFEELKKLKPKQGELAELEVRHRTLAYQEDIQAAGACLLDAGYNFYTQMEEGLSRLENYTDSESELGKLAAEGREYVASINEWRRILSSSLPEDGSPHELAALDNRLKKLRTAMKKFGKNEQELVDYYEELAQKVDGEPAEFRLDKLESERTALELNCKEKAKKLHELRLKAAKKLAALINEKLESLELSGELFGIKLEKGDSLTSSGNTKLNFTFKAGPNAPEQALHQTASGGERSRALLALCASLGDSLPVSLMVFDEIDTSIGSRLGRPVAEFLRLLSKGRQVLCVTHLAPVAAGGERHFLIKKDSAQSELCMLDDQARLHELAQMLAGEKNSEAALEQARHMLESFKVS